MNKQENLIKDLKKLQQDLIDRFDNDEADAVYDAIEIIQSLTTEPQVDKVTAVEWWDKNKSEAMDWSGSCEVITKDEFTQWMQTYATQSNAEAMRGRAIGFATWVELKGFKRKFDDKTKTYYWIYTEEYGVKYTDNELYNIYLTNKEK